MLKQQFKEILPTCSHSQASLMLPFPDSGKNHFSPKDTNNFLEKRPFLRKFQKKFNNLIRTLQQFRYNLVMENIQSQNLVQSCNGLVNVKEAPVARWWFFFRIIDMATCSFQDFTKQNLDCLAEKKKLMH